MWNLILGAVLAIISGAVANWLTYRMGKSRWLSERRYETYSRFFDQWENVRQLVRNKVPEDQFDAGLGELAITARQIDLLGDHRGRNAAWDAYGVLQKARDEPVDDEQIKDQINRSLNSFKRDIGVRPQTWMGSGTGRDDS